MARALVLDLDDTLVAASGAMRRAERILLELGVDREQWKTTFRQWWGRFEAGEVPASEMRYARWADLGLTGEAGVAADMAWRRVAFAGRLRNGARVLLRDARRTGFRLAILTNGTIDPQRLTIARTGLLDLVDGAIVTEELGLHKPHPEPFRRAAALVGAAPTEATMVGDTFSTDIVGALSAGFCRAVWVTRHRRAPHSDPRVVLVRRLDEVLAAVSSPS